MDTDFEESSLRVLVVDDQSSMRSILRRLLRDQGITDVIEAHDGASALSVIGDHQGELAPDVVICDLHMEGMDGLEFVNALRRQKSLIPVLVLTGDQDKMLHEVSEQIGAVKVLSKPISGPDLITEINAAIGFNT